MKTVLYICDCSIIAGSSLSLINMIESLGTSIKPIVAVSAEGPISDYCEKNNIRCIVSPFRYNYYKYKGNWLYGIKVKVGFIYKSFITNRKFINDVVLALKDENVNIVHTNSSAVPVGTVIAKRLHAKHVWHVREFLGYFNNAKILGGKKKLMRDIKRADAVICSSHPLINYLSLENHPNVQCIWDAVKKKNDTCFNEKKEKYFVFCCGELSEFKGADYLVDTFGKSRLSEDGYHLLMIGKCHDFYKKELLEIAKKYNAQSNIIFNGFANEQQIKDKFSKATAFIQCSKIEGLGRVVIEAMFYGCPVIARNNGGTADIITNEQNGFLFNTKEELILRMKQLSQQQSSEVAKKAQEFAIASFSIEDFGNKILKVYNSL